MKLGTKIQATRRLVTFYDGDSECDAEVGDTGFYVGPTANDGYHWVEFNGNLTEAREDEFSALS